MPTCENHKWKVYSTALCPPTILVSCDECDVIGSIIDYTQKEWGEAFYAPNNPYEWNGHGEVINVCNIKEKN